MRLQELSTTISTEYWNAIAINHNGQRMQVEEVAIWQRSFHVRGCLYRKDGSIGGQWREWFGSEVAGWEGHHGEDVAADITRVQGILKEAADAIEL